MADDTIGLRISPDLTLPLQAVTETFVVVAKRGSGKTYAASVMAEEMLAAELPVCVVDPLGVFWGLRSTADGKGDGFPVVIFGGEHADVPLEEHAGSLIADVLIDQRFPAVLDLSLLSKTASRRFMTAFLTRLYHRNRDPLHLIIDEADLFAPQSTGRGGGGEAPALLGAMEDIVRRGRARGLGCTLITQRPAVLHKDVLSQAEVLVALRMTGVRDVAAIDEWVKLHADEDEARALKQSLPSLPIGTAWVWSPGWLGILQRVEVRRRTTFDSSATPRMGERRVTPKRMADVDLQALGEQIAATVEKAKADDPKQLRARITELERELAAERARPTPAPERVEVVPGELIAAVNKARVALMESASRLEATSADIGEAEARAHARNEAAGDREDLPRARAAGDGPRPVERQGAAQRPDPAPRREPSGAAVPRAAPPAAGSAAAELTKSERALLTALVHRGPTLDRRSLGAISGYSWKSGGFRNTLSSLRTKGYLDGSDPVTITPAGHGALGHVDPAPTGTELLAFWSGRIGKAEKAIAHVLFDAYPGSLTREEVADACGYMVTSGGFRNALSRLRTLGLIEPGDPLRASDSLGGGS